MRTIRIPKRGGGSRMVYVQSPTEKGWRHWLGWELQQRLAAIPESRVIHGFFPGRSPVTNALAHAGKRYTLTLDLADFFDSVTEKQIADASPMWPEYARWACKDGAPRQGLSSSPAAANLAASVLDSRILRGISENGRADRIVYTRYADDLTFSCDEMADIRWLRAWVPVEVEAMGWHVNHRKTRIQVAAFGRRVICGVSVGGAGDIRVPRSFRRKLRAALHRHPGSNKTRGLVEWAKLRLPGSNPAAGLGHWDQSGVKVMAERAFGVTAGWKITTH